MNFSLKIFSVRYNDFISICIGSSCHLKGSEKLVELFQNKIKEGNLDDVIVLSGSFCLGKCNRVGVTVSVGDGISEKNHPRCNARGL